MRIAHFGPTSLPFNFPLGGAVQRRIRELARQQVTAGHSVTIFSAESTTSEFEYDGATVRGVRCRLRGIARDLEYLKESRPMIHGGNFDVLHFHSLAEGAWLFRRVEAPKVLSYDYFKFRRGRETPLHHLYCKFLRLYDACLPVSDYCRDESLRYWPLDPDRCTTLHNGVNTTQFSPEPAQGRRMREKLGADDDATLVLYVGRICTQKGTDLLLDAFRILRQQDARFRLVIAGPSAQFGRTGLDPLAERVRAEAIYAGALDEADLPSMYNAADICVLPTREYEMFGMAAAEAQACGKPVVCSRHGGLPEVVTPETGELFANGDLSALLTAILKLNLRRKREPQLPAAARHNGERFAWQRIGSELDAIYNVAGRIFGRSRH